MSRDMQCPYCSTEQSVSHDDGHGYAEDVLHEHSCTECEKMFVFTTMIHFSYSAHAADCLNGSPHKYEKTKTYPPQYAVYRCADCGHELPIGQEPCLTA